MKPHKTTVELEINVLDYPQDQSVLAATCDTIRFLDQSLDLENMAGRRLDIAGLAARGSSWAGYLRDAIAFCAHARGRLDPRWLSAIIQAARCPTPADVLRCMFGVEISFLVPRLEDGAARGASLGTPPKALFVALRGVKLSADDGRWGECTEENILRA